MRDIYRVFLDYDGIACASGYQSFNMELGCNCGQKYIYSPEAVPYFVNNGINIKWM